MMSKFDYKLISDDKIPLNHDILNNFGIDKQSMDEPISYFIIFEGIHFCQKKRKHAKSCNMFSYINCS